MRNPPVNPPQVSYPVHLDLRGRRVLVVGAGRTAAGKIERLLPTGADITVVAPQAVQEVVATTTAGGVRWHQRGYERGEVASYRLAITCTGHAEVDGQVFADGEATGVWVNSADDVDRCSFILPAVARRGPISVTVATAGQSPALASWLRRRFQADLDDGMEPLLEILSSTRSELRRTVGSSEHPGWHEALDLGLLERVRAGDEAGARHSLRSALGLPTDAPAEDKSTVRPETAEVKLR